MPKRKHFLTIFRKNKRALKIAKFFVFGIVSSFLIMVLIALSIFIYYAGDLPRPERFTEKKFIESTKIFDRTGEIILYELYGEEKRELVSLENIPQHLIDAVLATEDSNFYSHYGLDFRGILRSIQINLKLRKPASGGSTISQQLIRSTFLTHEKTIGRKVKEIVLALELERRYSKEEILEWYLNQIPLGPNVYGVESASRYFFDKSVREISVAESAILASLIQAPSYLSGNKEILISRQGHVLNRMVAENYLSEEEKETAKNEDIIFSEKSQFIKAPHFTLYVQNYLIEKYGRDFLDRGGLKIYTSLDINLQEKAEKAILNGVEKNKRYNSHNASLTAIDPKTGEILAMVGSANWFGESYPGGCVSGKDCLFDPKVNIAIYGIGRQPGSSFKPFVYAAAFEKGYNDSFIVIDEETNFGIFGGKPYIPRNYDGLFRGPVTLRNALAQSLNVPAVKVMAHLVGQEESIEIARKLGITTLNKPNSYYGLSIVLGGGEVRLMDMVSSYGVFANDGIKVPTSFILKIEDSSGNIIEQNKNTGQRIIKSETARLITDILSDNEARAPVFGRNSQLYFSDHDVASKTGTTNEFKDAWIIGYTPEIVVGVWTGNNNSAPMINAPGITVAAPIWREFIETFLNK